MSNWIWLLLLLIGFTVHREEPGGVAVKWATAVVQHDEGTQYQLLKKKSDALHPADGPDNDLEIKEYELKEWKVDKKTYYEELAYIHPENGSEQIERMKVVQTDNGWKRETYLPPADFREATEGKTPKVHKEGEE